MDFKGVVVKVEPQSDSETEEELPPFVAFELAEDNQHVKTEREDSDEEEQDMSHNSMTADQPEDDCLMKRDFKIELNEDDDEDTPHWNKLEHHAQDIDQVSDGIHPERPALTNSHSDINPQCDAAPKVSMPTVDLKTIMPRHTRAKSYKCTECEASFSFPSSLKRHMLRHTRVKLYKCTECEASFTWSSSLNSHMRKHTGVKPYKCTECEATFTQSGNLKTHMRKHTGVKPYKCTECEASFTESGNCKAHMRIHTGVKPYKCTECEASFTWLESLKIHMHKHTGVKPYSCTECEDSFTKSGNLKRHMMRKHRC